MFISSHFKLTSDEFNHLYWTLGKSMNEIAKMFGSQGCKLKTRILKLGIPLKDKEKSYLDRDINPNNKNRKYNVNHNFFDVESSSRNWVLGLLASDGNVNQELNRIVLASKDIDMLEEVKNLLEYDGNLSKNNTNCSILRVASSIMAKKLNSISITPDKSFTLKYLDIDSEFDRDFIRGVFDGDGTVHVQKKFVNYPHLKCTIVTVSEEFSIGLSNKLFHYGLKHTIYKIDPSGNRKRRYNIHFGGIDAIRFLNFIYKGIGDNLHLKRKKIIFDEYISNYGKYFKEVNYG